MPFPWQDCDSRIRFKLRREMTEGPKLETIEER
jgi:hypothetical protein